MTLAESKPAHQNQDQQDNNYKSETTAPIVTHTIKRAAAESSKAAQQCDHQDDENDGPD